MRTSALIIVIPNSLKPYHTTLGFASSPTCSKINGATTVAKKNSAVKQFSRLFTVVYISWGKMLVNSYPQLDLRVGSSKSTWTFQVGSSRSVVASVRVTVEIFWRRRSHCKSFQVDLMRQMQQRNRLCGNITFAASQIRCWHGVSRHWKIVLEISIIVIIFSILSLMNDTPFFSFRLTLITQNV